MKTSNYWSAIVSTGLITALLLGTALTVAAIDFSVPAIPNDLKNAQKDLDKAAATPKPSASPRVLYHSSNGLQLPTPTPSAGDAFSNRYAPKPTPKPGKNIGDYVSGQTVPNGDAPKPASKPAKSDDILTGDYPKGPQSSSASDKTANNTYDGSPIHYNKPKPTSDTEDWHKKNKKNHMNKHHHDDDQNQGND